MPSAPPKIRSTGLTPNFPTPPRHAVHSPYTYTSASPYPSPDSDSDSTTHTTLPAPSYTATLRIRASIAAVPETRLREIMVRLVDRTPGFQNAVAKELLASTAGTDNAPLSPPVRRRRRRSGKSSVDASGDAGRPCVNCGANGGERQGVCVYHPGRLEEAVYEFPSRTPGGYTFQVRRKIAMWSCCDEDARSPGCAAAAAHVRAGAGRGRSSRVRVGAVEVAGEAP